VEATTSDLHPALQYVRGVLDGTIVVGEYVKLAVQRHVDDLTRTDFPFYFDPEAAQRPIDFTQELCCHSKGEWAGQPIKLEPWQQFEFWCVFGWKRSDNGLRRFRTIYEKVARKNGKSTKMSAVGLYLLLADNEPGAEVYSAATKKDQAKIIHEEAMQMVRKSPELAAELTVVKNNISHVDSASKFEPLSADDKTLDGLNIHGGLIDEIHAHPNRGVYDVLDTATGSRRQSLIWCITTAGIAAPNSIALELEDYSQKVLKRIVEDETFFALLYDIDEGDDWTDERVWCKANPNLGVSVKLDDLRRKCVKAKETPAAQNNFKCKHLNQWSNSRSRWVPVEKWKDCTVPFTEQELHGKECWAGLDLSSTIDVTALAMVFPWVNGRFRAIFRFWVPKENAELRARRDKVPYTLWIDQGFITASEGSAIDYDGVRADINALSKVFKLKEIGADPWNATQTLQQLKEQDGIAVVEIRQGFASMSAPMKHLQTLVMDKKIEHNGNPVMTWMWDNISAKTDPAGNIKPDKEKSAERIDGAVALIMAVDRAALRRENTNPYETGGLFAV
jgi:phage terminase large subunit-like protein